MSHLRPLRDELFKYQKHKRRSIGIYLIIIQREYDEVKARRILD